MATSSRSNPFRPSVLVVEDEPGVLRMLARYLEGIGCAPRIAASAEEGLKIAASERIDVVLLDIELPGMTGLRAIGEFKDACAAPIFLMSGHNDEELRKDALLLGAKELLGKPIDFEELKASLSEFVPLLE